jgi:hypothetical protein
MPFNEKLVWDHRAVKIKDPWYWLKDRKHVAIARTAFIEIQAPILDTKFFAFFLRKVWICSTFMLEWVLVVVC